MSVKNNLNRELKARHLIMMALGGTIGTGLLLASGGAIHDGGPGGAMLAYILVAFVVYFTMASLGEMAAHSPTTGSFCDYSAKYVDKSFGFAMTWNYWFNWVFVVASEVIAAGFIMQFWFPNVDVWIWTIIFFCLILAINLAAVELYGEVEYWMAFVKISAVIIFIIVGTLMIFGLVGDQGAVGFTNITIGDAPFHAGLFGFLSVFLIVGYSFQGTELIGIAAGEAKDPQKNIPKAIKSIFWRILFFYIFSIAIIGFLIPYTSPHLINEDSNVALSPFTLIFENAGIEHAASLMNVVVITAILSAANASMYTASRVLWYSGKAKVAPASLDQINKHGVPVKAVLVTAAICVVLITASVFDSGLIFTWLVNIISLAGYIAWFGICLSHYRFRKAYLLQGNDLNKLPYRARWFPFAPLCAMAAIVVIMLGQQVMAVVEGKASISDFMATYFGVLLFFILMFVYKKVKKTKVITLKNVPITDLSK